MKRSQPSSLAGKLGRIPHPPPTEKPRPPKVEKPQVVAPANLGATKPKPAKPNKPARLVMPKPGSAPRQSAPAVSPPRRSVAGRLGSLKRDGRGR